MKKKSTRARVWPIIRVIQRKSKTVWEVDTGFAVKPRIRKKFDDEHLASAFAEKLRVRRTNEGLHAFELSISQRHDAQEAVKVLEGLGVSLKDAAEFYLRHAQVRNSGITLKAVWEELLDFKERIQKKRPEYTKGIRTRLKHFIDEFGERHVGDVPPTEIQEWLYRDRGISDLTRRNYFALLSVLFGFAQGKRDRRRPTAAPYRLDNPMDAVARPNFVMEPPEILTVEQAEVLLSASRRSHNKLGLLPYVVLALFCGVRAAELGQLTWEDVNLRKKQVTIPARIAKKRRLRNVPIPENALAWMQSFKDSKGTLAPENCARRLCRLVKEAGFAEWPQNALRHSFGSYYFALTDNAPETAARLGHKGDDVLFEHYRALADKEDAQRYFSLMPPTGQGRGLG